MYHLKQSLKYIYSRHSVNRLKIVIVDLGRKEILCSFMYGSIYNQLVTLKHVA